METTETTRCNRRRKPIQVYHPAMFWERGGCRTVEATVEAGAEDAVQHLATHGDGWSVSNPLLWIGKPMTGHDTLIFFPKYVGSQDRIYPKQSRRRAFVGSVDLDPGSALLKLRLFQPVDAQEAPETCCLRHAALIGLESNDASDDIHWYATVHTIPVAMPLQLPPLRPSFPLGATTHRHRTATATEPQWLELGGVLVDGGFEMHRLWQLAANHRPVGWEKVDHISLIGSPPRLLRDLDAPRMLAPDGQLTTPGAHWACPFDRFTTIGNVEELITSCRIEPRVLGM